MDHPTRFPLIMVPAIRQRFPTHHPKGSPEWVKYSWDCTFDILNEAVINEDYYNVDSYMTSLVRSFTDYRLGR